MRVTCVDCWTRTGELCRDRTASRARTQRRRGSRNVGTFPVVLLHSAVSRAAKGWILSDRIENIPPPATNISSRPYNRCAQTRFTTFIYINYTSNPAKNCPSPTIDDDFVQRRRSPISPTPRNLTLYPHPLFTFLFLLSFCFLDSLSPSCRLPHPARSIGSILRLDVCSYSPPSPALLLFFYFFFFFFEVS